MKRALIVMAVLFGGRASAQDRPHLELPQQSLTDGDKVKLGPMSIPSSRAERDTRPLMIGGGILVLAAAMWWGRKQRERFDRSDATDSPSRATTESREDTDDLQAAARGDDDNRSDGRRTRSSAEGDAKVDNKSDGRRTRSSAEGDAKVDDEA